LRPSNSAECHSECAPLRVPVRECPVWPFLLHHWVALANGVIRRLTWPLMAFWRQDETGGWCCRPSSGRGNTAPGSPAQRRHRRRSRSLRWDGHHRGVREGRAAVLRQKAVIGVARLLLDHSGSRDSSGKRGSRLCRMRPESSTCPSFSCTAESSSCTSSSSRSCAG